MLDGFINYFANPITLVFTGLFIIVGILIGLFLRPWMGNQVMKFIPSNHRFIDLEIDEETAISVQCKKKKGMPIQRFFKLHPGFTGIVGRVLKKAITRYIGLEGTAYTWKLEDGRWKMLGKLGDAVKTVWGAAFWATVPEIQREKLEESRIQVTVGLDKAPLTPAGMRSISEEDIKQEEDRQASKTFWREHGAQMRGYFINMILAGGTGFAICCALIFFGIFKMPTASPEPVQQAAQAGAQILRSLFMRG